METHLFVVDISSRNENVVEESDLEPERDREDLSKVLPSAFGENSVRVDKAKELRERNPLENEPPDEPDAADIDWYKERDEAIASLAQPLASTDTLDSRRGRSPTSLYVSMDLAASTIKSPLRIVPGGFEVADIGLPSKGRCPPVI